jgi:uncharacterized protein YukJ
MAIKYGVLRARVVKLLHHTPDDPKPHLEVLVTAGNVDYRLAVNVRSDDETDLLFHAEPNFQNALLTAITAPSWCGEAKISASGAHSNATIRTPPHTTPII